MAIRRRKFDPEWDVADTAEITSLRKQIEQIYISAYDAAEDKRPAMFAHAKKLEAALSKARSNQPEAPGWKRLAMQNEAFRLEQVDKEKEYYQSMGLFIGGVAVLTPTLFGVIYMVDCLWKWLKA